MRTLQQVKRELQFKLLHALDEDCQCPCHSAMREMEALRARMLDPTRIVRREDSRRMNELFMIVTGSPVPSVN